MKMPKSKVDLQKVVPNVIVNTGAHEVTISPESGGNIKLAGGLAILTLAPGGSMCLGPDGWLKVG